METKPEDSQKDVNFDDWDWRKFENEMLKDKETTKSE